MSKHNINDMNQLAKELGQFLKEFHSIETTGGPKAGKHNFYRGGAHSAYDHKMQIAIPKIENSHDKGLGETLWRDALSSQWLSKPVGLMEIGNIIVSQGKLKAIIDFGQLAIGDPACDLVIAWNFFSKKNRSIFKKTLGLNKDTWVRALGWAFWKVLCWPVKDTDVGQVIQEIFADYQTL